MLIRKIFWPFFTLVVFIAVMTIWFGAGREERYLNDELSQLIAQNAWFSYDVKGDSVIVRGLAPDAETRDNVINKVKEINKAGSIYSEITLPKDHGGSSLAILIDNDGITLRGALPRGVDRFGLIDRIEKEKTGMIIYDEIDMGNSVSVDFDRYSDYIISLLPQIKTGAVELRGDRITADANTGDLIIKAGQLPKGLKLDKNCVWQQIENSFWQNPCNISN